MADIYNKVKFVPEMKQKKVAIYSTAGERKNSALSVWVEKPPVAVVPMA